MACAVITDALSDDYFLPVWIDYYGRCFGAENLFVVSYERDLAIPPGRVGRQLRLERPYDQHLRVQLINEVVPELLKRYACVIRVDVDEFLVPDPRKYADLRQYVETRSDAYVTAQGLDVVETAADRQLAYDVAPLLGQRSAAVKASAYSKTCLVRTPIRWFPGFHTADVAPAFDDLYLFHMKFADAGRRLVWFDHMAERCKADAVQVRHFRAGRREFLSTLDYFRALPPARGEAGLRDSSYRRIMESAVRLGPSGDYGFRDIPTTAPALCEIPADFAAAF